MKAPSTVLGLAIALCLAAGAPAQDAPVKKSIAMLPFKTAQPSYRLGQNNLVAHRLAQDLRDEFNRYFTQSRKFAVLSRQDDDAIQAEESRIAGGNYRPEELDKFGKKLGADVLVSGEIKEFYVAAPRTIAVSGGSVVDRAVFVLAYRMVELATGKILDTDNITIDLTRAEIASARGDTLTLCQMLMSGAMLEMAKVIDPAKIVKRMKNGDYVINQGGSTMVEGAYLDAYVLGEEIIDPDSGESLGGAEEMVGIVQVVRVDKKLSYARLYSGKIDDDAISDGVVVRGHRPTQADRAAAAAAAEAARKKAAEGVSLPFE